MAAPRRASRPPFWRALRALARDHGRPVAQNSATSVQVSPTCFGAGRPPATSSLTPIIRGHRRLSAAFAARHDESRAAAKILRRRVEMRGKSGVFWAPPRKKRRAGTALLRGSHCAGLEAARGFPSCAAVADFAGGRFGAKRPGGRRHLGEIGGSIFTRASPKLSTRRERAR